MRYYLDTRSIGRDGRCPLRLVISKDGRTARQLTGIRITPDEWNGERCSDARKNVRMKDILDNAEDYVLRLKMEGRYGEMTASEVAAELGKKVLAVETRTSKRETFAFHLEKYRDRQPKRGTWEVYDRTLKLLREFDKDFDVRTFKDINYAYLTRLESWYLGKGRKVNSLSVIMRNMRTVFNEARREEATTLYPFNKYKIRQEETRKRSLNVEDLRRFIECPVLPDQQRYKDYFLLMVYLIGINTTDLFHARPEDLKDGRLFYQRDKTGKFYSIKVEPEAMEIIDRYRGKSWLLEPLDEHGDFLSWRSQLNKRLKAIGHKTGKRGKVLDKGPFPEISTYWARHTWATLAYQIGIPIDIIGQALGHSDRSHAVTFTYIRPDASKVDEANRRVIDYIKNPTPEGMRQP